MAHASAFDKVVELARERPEWLFILEAACAEAEASERYGGRFAGRWVLQRAAEQSGQSVWKPGLRLLVGYGLMRKDGESTRGGRRAYYRMPNWRDIKESVQLIKTTDSPSAES
jgi:hypothetical protein